MEAVAVVVGRIGLERVAVGLLEAILSFLKRGMLADVYAESAIKSKGYLLVSRPRKE